jgi:lipopolysaccharide transport system permease protein
MTTSAAADRPVPPGITIEVVTGRVPLALGEIWAYRELVHFLVWRDLKVRYAQILSGVGWAIAQPFLTMIVCSIFFGALVNVPSDGIPYPAFSYAALVPWMFFANGLSRSANSLVGSAHLITKVYFPRLTIPIAAVLVGLPDFVFAFLTLAGMLVYFGAAPSLAYMWLPVLLLLACVTALGAGLWLAAASVKYRDVRHLVPFLTQLWFFATPIAYPSSLLDEPWRTLYGLNPMVGVVEGFRWALLGSQAAPWAAVAVSALMATAILVGGAYHFRQMERNFADAL